ncbi:MAG: hypothetical protein V3S82_00120 [Dehalococcoidia bacterium]
MKPQLVVVPIAVAFMLLGVVLGALRLLSSQGILSPTPLASLQSHHGALRVFGFLAPLLLTERYLGAVHFSLNRSIHALPFLAIGGGILKLLSWVTGVAALNTLGSLAVVAAVVLYIYILYTVSKQSAQPLPFRFMILGALVLLAGALINIGRSPVVNPSFTLLLISFPILTILGERVELSRFLSPEVYRRAGWGFWAAVAASALLVLRLTVIDSGYLVVVWAVLLAVVAVPVLRPELTLIRLGKRGLHRYLGRHLIVAYGWFFLGLLVLVISGEGYPLYDAATHALAIGFVFTMIMAHAPVIAPVILHRAAAEDKLSLYPLALLTAGTAMRVAGYPLNAVGVDIPALVGLSGLVILLAIITFVVMMVRSFRQA